MYSKENLKLVLFGTPSFAVASFEKIAKNKFNIVAVVTAPDKPAGRGYLLQESEVKKWAKNHDLPILQPTNLKSESFQQELNSFQADLQIVIAFRMLPEKVWNNPPLGTFNLHASLLPQYRGAAPINWAIINGEKTTGVTTFFLKHEIDTGDIICQDSCEITEQDNFATLHDKLMEIGANLVLTSLNNILSGNLVLIHQSNTENHKIAPKLNKETGLIQWNLKAEQVHNLIRGLSPYPAAYTHFNGKQLKLFSSSLTSIPSSEIGKIERRNKNELYFHCSDFLLKINELQLEGKKRCLTQEFINGITHLI